MGRAARAGRRLGAGTNICSSEARGIDFGMLIELRIENLLLIERAELEFVPGFNAITGETGAGKTMLAHAIDLLLGGKSRRSGKLASARSGSGGRGSQSAHGASIVRPGAREAYVEGLFAVPDGLLEREEFAELRDRLPDPNASELALARKVTPDGRTRAFIEGRAASAAELRALGGAMVSFYGQHEHRKLTLAATQLATLDGFCGEEHLLRVREAERLHARARKLRRRLSELDLVDGRRERELGLIEFELAEIEALCPDPAEHAALVAERDRLRAVDSLRVAGAEALACLVDDDSGGAATATATAARQLANVAASDADLAQLAQRVETLAIEMQDVAAELRSYTEGIAADPERLALVEERLDEYERLIRKHGTGVEDLLRHAERCRHDRERLAGSHEESEATRSRLQEIVNRQSRLAAGLSKTRRRAAPRLADAVRERLVELALPDATFEIRIDSGHVRDDAGRDDVSEIGPTGSDAVEFMIAPNPGLPATPLRETASGGELSRVMLALLTAAGAHDDHTFVFDEIDAGIGGHTARAVGRRLRALAESRQVICITHLPQVAAAAARHFQIDKVAVRGEARTEVRTLDKDGVVDELCRMLGAGAGDAGARRHARELLAAS